MSDNIALMQGSGAWLSTNEIEGVHVLRLKVQFGGAGTALDVSTENPLPVNVVTPLGGAVLTGPLPAGTNAIGSVDINSLPPLPAGANPIGTVAVTSLPTVTIGAALPAGANDIGRVAVSSLPNVTVTALPEVSIKEGSVEVTKLPTVTIGAALPEGNNRLGSVDITSLPSLPAGSNAIGTVAVTSVPPVTIGASLPAGNAKIGGVDIVSPLPAGTNAIGKVEVTVLPPLPAGANALGSVGINAPLPAGANAIGTVAVTAMPDVTVGAALPVGTNTIGAVNVKPATSGGLSIYRRLGLAATGQLIKAAAGQVFGWHISNVGAAGVYVKLYNLATAPVVGSSTPVMTMYLGAGQTMQMEHVNGIAFATGIGIAATTGYLDSDTGAPTANTVFANLFYK